MLDYNYNKILTNSIKKKLQTLFKSFGYFIGSIFYGRINGVIDSKNHESIEILNQLLDQKYSYNIYKMKKTRLYTDTVNDTAFIIGKKIIKGPSYQYRSIKLKDVKNSNVKDNIVFEKGTSRVKKNFRGTVLSLLTGGAGNSNYWHWLFDVLPRLKILEEKINLDKIDFFLFPDISEKFQKASVDLLNIPHNKVISSKEFRHISADQIIAVDHPYVIKNDPSIEIQNMPQWILKFLREKFVGKKILKKFPEKFYIDRKDSKSNHRHLRRILNEDEVKKFLIQKGFSIVTLSDYTFEDQVNLFYNAKKIVGLHGAGFANLTFSQSETLVLELKPESAGSVIENLAKNLNLDYREISIKSTEYSNNDQQGLISVPINLLEKKIEIDYK